jgi:flagellar biosynthesis protein FliP
VVVVPTQALLTVMMLVTRVTMTEEMGEGKVLLPETGGFHQAHFAQAVVVVVLTHGTTMMEFQALVELVVVVQALALEAQVVLVHKTMVAVVVVLVGLAEALALTEATVAQALL